MLGRWPRVKKVKRSQAWLGAAAALTAALLVAMPALAGPFLNGWHADSAAHTFLYPSPLSSSEQDWSSNLTNSRTQDFNPTDLVTEVVTYHYNGGLTWPYVDVSWWAANITAPGSVGCNVPVSGSSVHCDHWHMIMDTNAGLSEAGEDYVACQEIAHSVGLDHWNDADSVKNNPSCVATGEDAYFGSILTTHDKDHINGHY